MSYLREFGRLGGHAKRGEAGVDRYVRRWEKASDHAPAWIVRAEA